MLDRRALLGGAVGSLVLAACDVDDLRPPEASGPSDPDPTSAARPSDPDAALLAGVIRQIEKADARVHDARRRRRLRAALRPLSVLHAAHLGALSPHVTIRAVVASGRPPRTLADVVAGEQALRERLVEAAVAAESGAVARLLASMSASISQQLVVLGE